MLAETINSIIKDFGRHSGYAFDYQQSGKPMEACYHDGVLEGMIMVLDDLGEVDPTAVALADTLRKIRADMEQAQKELLS